MTDNNHTESIESKLSKILEIVQDDGKHSPNNDIAQDAKSNDADGGQ